MALLAIQDTFGAAAVTLLQKALEDAKQKFVL